MPFSRVRFLRSLTRPFLPALFLLVPLLITPSWAQEEPKLQKFWTDLGIYIGSGGRQRSRETQTLRHELAQAGTRLAQERGLARQAGILVTWQEMQRPLPPVEQNAAIDYVELTRLLTQRPLDKKTEDILARIHLLKMEPSDLAVVTKTVADRKEVLDLLRRATDKPACVFQRDWSRGADVTFPEYVQMRRAMRLLKAECFLLARSGHKVEAVREASRGFRLAAHASSERMLISQLVGIAIESITLAGLQEILEQCGPNPDIANHIHQALAERSPQYDLRTGLCAEAGVFAVQCSRLGQSQTFEQLEFMTQSYGEEKGTGQADVLHSRPPTSRKPYPGETQMIHELFDAVSARYLARTRHLVRLAEEAPRKRLIIFKQEAHQPPSKDLVGELASAFNLNIPDLAVTMLRIQAKEQVLSAAASLLAYRAAHPSFPPDLQKAFARPPHDPFTGAPVRYRVEANGFVVYSVGEKGTFDGGKPGMKRIAKESYFRCASGNDR